MKYYLRAFKNFFNFEGRANQSEFWYFFLFNMLFSITAKILDDHLGIQTPLLKYGTIYQIYTIIVLVPGLALTVRRLHHVGKSGAFIFIVLIPVIGIIWLLVVLAGERNPGRNKERYNLNII